MSWYYDQIRLDPESLEFIISDEADLAGLAKLVNEGNDFKDKTIKLEGETEINLSAHYWTPIGDEYRHPFSGTFKGNGHTISYLYINVENYDSDNSIDYIGLFGYTKNSTVENLTISDSVISVKVYIGYPVYVGGFVGRTTGTVTISNCHYSGKIDVDAKDCSSHLGGITGYSEKGTSISNCSNSANLTNVLDVNSPVKGTILTTGGIVGHNSGSITNCSNLGRISSDYIDLNGINYSYLYSYLGGICGYNDKTGEIHLENYTADNEVSSNSSGHVYLGGICGDNYGSISISNYTNNGNLTAYSANSSVYLGSICGNNSGTLSAIKCTSSSEINADISSNGYEVFVGGMVGFTNKSGTITDCYNSGNVYFTSKYPHKSASIYIGGIVGWNVGTVSNCYNLGTVEVISDKDSNGAAIRAGGIIGNNRGNIINCYNSGNLSSKSVSDNLSNMCTGGIAGYNDGGNISSCYNTGKIDSFNYSTPNYIPKTDPTALRNTYAGGIVGYNFGTISNSYNTGSVSSEYISKEETILQSKITTFEVYSGGIAGCNPSNSSKIENCYNTGEIKSRITSSSESNSGTIASGTLYFNAYSGGIVGKNYVYSAGSIKNCYNTGAVTASSTFNVQPPNFTTDMSSYAGGISGYCYDGTVNYCYSTGHIESTCTSNSEDKTQKMSAYGGGIAGDSNDKTNFLHAYYLEGCIENPSDSHGIPIQSDQMNDSYLLGGNNPDINLNNDQTTTPWSPDIFNANDGYPVLADVPTQTNLNDTPNSTIFIIADGEETQKENYLMTDTVVKQSNLNLKCPDEFADAFKITNPSYSWKKLNLDYPRSSDKVWNIIESTTANAVRLTDDGTYLSIVYYDISESSSAGESKTPVTYHYTSLSRTVELKNGLVYDSNDGSGKTYSVIPDETGNVTVEDNMFHYKGHAFVGWNDAADGSGSPYGIGETITITSESKILYAQWEEASTVTIDVSQDNATIVITDEAGKEIKPEKDGTYLLPQGKYTCKVFKSGYVTSTKEIVITESDASNNKETTVSVSLSSSSSGGIPVSYNVVYNANGGSGTLIDTSSPYHSGVTVLVLENNFTKDGYTFKNWNTKADGSGTSYSAGDRFSINSNVTLYAQWEEASAPPVVQKVTVTFYIGNEVYKVIEVNKDSSLKDSFPVNPESSDNNSNFKEWNTKEDASGTAFTADSVVNEDTSVYAVWEKSSSSSSHSWWWIIIIIIILIVIIAAYYYYKKNQN